MRLLSLQHFPRFPCDSLARESSCCLRLGSSARSRAHLCCQAQCPQTLLTHPSMGQAIVDCLKLHTHDTSQAVEDQGQHKYKLPRTPAAFSSQSRLRHVLKHYATSSNAYTYVNVHLPSCFKWKHQVRTVAGNVPVSQCFFAGTGSSVRPRKVRFALLPLRRGNMKHASLGLCRAYPHHIHK